MSLISNVSSRVGDSNVVNSARIFLNTPAKKVIVLVAVAVIIALGVYLLRRCCPCLRLSAKAATPQLPVHSEQVGGLGLSDSASRLQPTNPTSPISTVTSKQPIIDTAGVDQRSFRQQPESQLLPNPLPQHGGNISPLLPQPQNDDSSSSEYDDSSSSEDEGWHPEFELPKRSDLRASSQLDPSLELPKSSDLQTGFNPADEAADASSSSSSSSSTSPIGHKQPKTRSRRENNGSRTSKFEVINRGFQVTGQSVRTRPPMLNLEASRSKDNVVAVPHGVRMPGLGEGGFRLLRSTKTPEPETTVASDTNE